MILVLLGTQNNSFHRLLEEIDKLIKNKVIDEEVVVQAGYTKYESNNMKIFDFELSEDEMARITSLNKNMRLGSDPDNFKF